MISAPPRVTFYLDFGAPECWLVMHQVGEICARRGVALELAPADSGAIDRLLGRHSGAPPEMERTWRREDLRRRASSLGLSLVEGGPTGDATAALRGCFTAAKAGQLETWCRRMLELRWALGAAIDDPAVLRRVAEDLGLRPEAMLASIESREAHDWLDRQAAQAVSGGVFGLPACVVDGELFYGEGRLPQLEDRLAELTLPEGTAATTSFNRWFGMRCLSRGEGKSEYEFVVSPRVTNRRGVAHGGVTSSMLDTALGSAVVCGIKPEEWCATLELSVQFRQPLRMGRVTAHGRMVGRGRHAAFAEGEILGPGGEVLASAHGTWYVWPSRPKS